jgi:sugar lactone lactonase YvrE
MGTELPSSGTELTLGPDGNLWFILESASPLIGRSTISGTLTTFSLPAGTTPSFLASGPDGNIWFTDFTNSKVGLMKMAGSVTLFDLVTPNAGPAGITSGPDGNLWFVESSANQIGRITTAGSVAEYRIPTPASKTARIATGADGAIWFTETVGKIGRITTTGSISEIRIPYANASPLFIIGKPDGTIWFTDSPGIGYNDRIGRLSPAAGCISNPQTLCLNIGAFSVTASFQTTPEGPSAPATAVAMTGSTGYFWFFDPNNVEMTVKVLDGCAVNGHYWFFAGGLTNVSVQISVTDTTTGASKPYSNLYGTPFQPIQDTAAFPCP